MLKNRSGINGKAPNADWEEMPDPAASVKALMRRGIFMDITGLEGSGKSTLALTVARLGKVAYVDIDQSVDRAKKPEGKATRSNIKLLPVRYAVPMGSDEKMVQEICAPVWTNMGKKLEAAVMDWARAAAIDTGTEMWELNRYASAGTLNPKGKRMDRVYGPINARMRSNFRSVYRTHGKHLITIHQLKDEYIDKLKEGEMQSVKTGKHIRAGFKEIGYLCDVTVRCFRDEKDKDDKFKAEIEICKLPPHGPDLEGMILTGDQMDFGWIIAMATGTEAEDWK